MSVSSQVIKRSIAVGELLLVSPAVLFMTALFARALEPPQFEPAHTAQQIVLWYAARPRLGLWVLLMALPLVVFVTGGATLLRAWKDESELRQAAQQTLAAIRAHLATLVVAVATVAAGGVLAIVAVHAIAG